MVSGETKKLSRRQFSGDRGRVMLVGSYAMAARKKGTKNVGKGGKKKGLPPASGKCVFPGGRKKNKEETRMPAVTKLRRVG